MYFHTLFFLAVVYLLSSSYVLSQKESTIDLEKLSNSELEAICTQLGFELIDKSKQGTELSREDYLEAARQCLAVKEQFDEILEQNPDLKAEYLNEVEGMKTAALAEQERLLKRKRELELELASSSKNVTESVIESKSEFGIPKATLDNATIQSPANQSQAESTQETASFTEESETAVDVDVSSASFTEESEPQHQNEKTAVDVDVASASFTEESEPQHQNETTPVDVDVDTEKDAKSDDNSMQVTPTPESTLSLPPAVKEFLDKYIPPSIQLMIRNMSIKVYKDIRRLLRLQVRLCRALVGELLQRIEEYKAAKNANSS